MKEEPQIIINGVDIGPACAMTIRVAIEVFATELYDSDLYRDRDQEDGLTKAYLQRINDIRLAMGIIG